jgi:ABC-type branched-subunit amino acid transport system substrate-binding protein
VNLHALRACALLAACFASGLAAQARPPALTPQEEAGRLIYQEGRSSVGDAFSGRIGIGGQEVPGAAVRCANCHGPDGLGRPEGGVRPSNITWSELTKAYGHAHDNGRQHPRFDEDSLKRAIVRGEDPAGHALDGAMPRFEISKRDLDALLAYMRKLEHLRDPGIGAGTLRLGTLLPAAGHFGEVGRAVQGILRAYLDRINDAGGIYGRRLELVVAEYSDRAGAQREVKRLVSEGDVFALVAPFAAGIEADLARLAGDARIPVVGPLTLFGDDPRASAPFVFHLLSGVGELAAVLAQHVGGDPNVRAQPAVLLHPDDAGGAALADSLQHVLGARGWTSLSRLSFKPGAFDSAGLAGALKSLGAQAVFLLGPGADMRALADASVKSGHLPLLLLPGPLAPREVLEMPKALDARVLLAYPTIPADQKPDALREYAGLFRARALDRGHQASQVPAYSSAVLLVEALKQAGRDVTREKLVSALESIQGFEPGLVPAVSYNARRRVGALGGYVVAVDLERGRFRPLGGFVQLP